MSAARTPYRLDLTDGEREIVLRALREARERTPATGVSPSDWLVKETLDRAKLDLETPWQPTDKEG